VGKGRLKERCGLESQTNFFPFKKSPKTECGLDLRIYGMWRGTSWESSNPVRSNPCVCLRKKFIKLNDLKMCVNIFWEQNTPSASSYLSAFPMSGSACSLDVPTHNGQH